MLLPARLGLLLVGELMLVLSLRLQCTEAIAPARASVEVRVVAGSRKLRHSRLSLLCFELWPCAMTLHEQQPSKRSERTPSPVQRFRATLEQSIHHD